MLARDDSRMLSGLLVFPSGLAEMTNARLPVPPGFTITTEVCNIYYKEKQKIPAPIEREIDEHVKKLNASLNRWETIKKWAVLDHDLSVDGGQLTPSLKVKRGVVAEQNKETLDGFYS